MTKLTLILTILGLAAAAQAIEKGELEERIRKLSTDFDAMQANPDKRIPADKLRDAKGILMMERTKAGFIFAYQGGGGVGMMKDPKTGKWGPLGFLGAREANLGFLVGGQQSFLVVLMMTTNSVQALYGSSADFGGEARATGGDQSAGVKGTFPPDTPSILIYDDRHGLYAGAALKGGTVSPDDQANRVYYGQSWSMKDLLQGKYVKPTKDATDLSAKITQYSKPPKK
jgi:lipid-binding SYLF domain-containing protein